LFVPNDFGLNLIDNFDEHSEGEFMSRKSFGFNMTQMSAKSFISNSHSKKQNSDIKGNGGFNILNNIRSSNNSLIQSQNMSNSPDHGRLFRKSFNFDEQL
jgi:hypothetical protein